MGGCSSTDLERVRNDTLSVLDEALRPISAPGSESGGGSVSGGRTESRSGSIEGNYVSIIEASKTTRDLGKVTVIKKEKNPQRQTRVVLSECSHPRIGRLSCAGYLYEISPEGWLIDEPIQFSDTNRPDIIIPSGSYYLKFESQKSGSERYATGDLEIAPFVTNYVTVELE